MKAALCFIISYEHILQKEQLWIDWIKPNKDIINIYFHYKDINLIKSKWIKMYTIPPDLVQQTSYYNVVPAYMSVISYAFHHDKENQWFCLLTDSCIPIISPEKFRQLFCSFACATIMRSKPAYWDIRIHRRANLRLLNAEYWLANDPWFTLCRKHVHQSILFLVGKHGIYDKINAGGLANESIFAIILQTFRELNNPKTYINESSTLCDWQRMSTPTSPYVFEILTEENKEIIFNLLNQNKYAIFLRKIKQTVSDSDIKEIWKKDFNHKYVKLYNYSYTYISINSKLLIIFIFLFGFSAFLYFNFIC
jgi:hypothetical protein